MRKVTGDGNSPSTVVPKEVSRVQRTPQVRTFFWECVGRAWLVIPFWTETTVSLEPIDKDGFEKALSDMANAYERKRLHGLEGQLLKAQAGPQRFGLHGPGPVSLVSLPANAAGGHAQDTMTLIFQLGGRGPMS